jgi:hypothetical protein
MNRTLEARIVKLEQAQAVMLEPLIVRRTSYLPGDVTGFEVRSNLPGGDFGFEVDGPRRRVLREPGESEDACFERACTGFAGVVTVTELRGPGAVAER